MGDNTLQTSHKSNRSRRIQDTSFGSDRLDGLRHVCAKGVRLLPPCLSKMEQLGISLLQSTHSWYKQSAKKKSLADVAGFHDDLQIWHWHTSDCGDIWNSVYIDPTIHPVCWNWKIRSAKRCHVYIRSSSRPLLDLWFVWNGLFPVVMVMWNLTCNHWRHSVRYLYIFTLTCVVSAIYRLFFLVLKISRNLSMCIDTVNSIFSGFYEFLKSLRGFCSPCIIIDIYLKGCNNDKLALSIFRWMWKV